MDLAQQQKCHLQHILLEAVDEVVHCLSPTDDLATLQELGSTNKLMENDGLSSTIKLVSVLGWIQDS